MAKVILQGNITVPSNVLVQFIDYLAEHRKLTLAEPGCLAFSVEQRTDNLNTFDVYEEFMNRDAFHLHKDRMAKTNWITLTQDAIRDYQVTGLD